MEEQEIDRFYKKRQNEVLRNKILPQKCSQHPVDFSSGDDCSSSYDFKMENTIIKQNNDLIALQEDLELKNKTISGLQEDLNKKHVLIQEMEETILSLNDTIESLQSESQHKNRQIAELSHEVQAKEVQIQEIKDSIMSQNKIIQILQSDLELKDKNIQELELETLRLKDSETKADNLEHVVSELTIKIKGLEDILKVKNEALQQSNQWQIEMKDEIELLSKEAFERETCLRSEYDREVTKLQQEFANKLKLLSEKKSLVETFLEKNIDMLLNKISEVIERGIDRDFDIGAYQKKYRNELEAMKLNISGISDKIDSENLNQLLQNFSMNMSRFFSSESSLRAELGTKLEELNELRNDLKRTRKTCDDLASNEQNLFSKLNLAERELSSTKEEKTQLQQLLSQANSKYEKAMIDFNRDRLEMENKYRQAVESYETDLVLLNKSLQELLSSIPTTFEARDDASLIGSHESSMSSIHSDIHSMISNPNIYNAQKLVSKSLCEVGKLRIEIKKMSQENKALKLAVEARSKALTEKVEELKKALGDVDFMKNQLKVMEGDKEFIQNKLKFVEEESTHFKITNQSLTMKIEELNKMLEKNQEDIKSLKQREQSLKDDYENCKRLSMGNLSPISEDRHKVSGVSDSELLGKGDVHTPDMSFQSLPGLVDVNVYTSTPFYRVFCDPQGGGEVVKPKQTKSSKDSQASLLKWMEKCQQLDKENKSLQTKIEDLELYNQDLKFTMDSVKVEMNVFDEKRLSLEKKLSMLVSLKERYCELANDNDLKDLTIKNLSKELEDVKNENDELFHKNLELEESCRKHLSNFTETKHYQNITSFSDLSTNTFNEKVKEIICLRREIRNLQDEKKSLTLKVDLLLESNNTYVAKLKVVTEKLYSCQNELETLTKEKLEICSANKVMNKELQLLQMRVDYLSSLRDNHWCIPSSVSILDEMQQDVLSLFKNALETKLEPTPGVFSPKDSHTTDKGDSVSIPQICKMLNQQLREEKGDLANKLNELEHFISEAKEGSTVSEGWLVQVDKMCRNILEELKYHQEQYFRIEEALRSTGKFHDELQKHKDEIRVKAHEISSFQKKFEEEKMKSRKSEVHLKILEQEIQEKNELIKILMDQKASHENEIKNLQKNLSETELKIQTNLKEAEWNIKLEQLKTTKQEIEEKLLNFKNADDLLKNEVCSKKVFEEVELQYNKALDEMRAYFNAEMMASIANIQEEHKEQVEDLQRVISEQAIRIGFLLKKNTLESREISEPETELLYINEDLRKQFELAVFALQQLHQEELQLVRLQLEAEKYSDVYQDIQSHQDKSLEIPKDVEPKEDDHPHVSLLNKLKSIVKEDFILRLKCFMSNWHSSYSEKVYEIEKGMRDGIKNYNELKTVPEHDSDLKQVEIENDANIRRLEDLIDSAKSFLQDIGDRQDLIITNLNNFVERYSTITLDCLEKVKCTHRETRSLLKLKEDLASIKKEKEELEKRHKNAIELLHADHKAEEEKIQLLLADIKKCCESGCDPNALIKIKDELEEKHKKELEELRTYYVQMCANMEKQYSEDVNSLHSRMLSLSSSCSDDIASDHMFYDKAGSGDHYGNLMFPEISSDIDAEKLSAEQLKLIEDLNCKWQEEVKEMKKDLENKYSKKIEQLQERISKFIYNNELEISVKCIKDEVMRDCKVEIETLEKEMASRMVSFDDEKPLKSELDCFEKLKCQTSDDKFETAYEQLIVDLMANFASKDTINKVTKDILLAALNNTQDKQKENASVISHFLKTLDNTLLTIENKIKDKENKLLSLQNKLNSFSQIVLSLSVKCKKYADDAQKKSNIFDNNLLLEKLVEEGYCEEYLPPELEKIYKIFKNKYDKLFIEEKNKFEHKLESLKEMFAVERGELEKSFEKDITTRPSLVEFDHLIKERDSLKQMTSTLKSAVSQLVSYLNTCEDELNRTVVDELLKICEDTPRKGHDIPNFDSPGFRRVHFAPEVEVSDLDESGDLSTVLRLQLDSCLSKLKLEAASLLGLTALQPPPANLNKQIENLQKENEELQREVMELKICLEKNQNDSLDLKEQLFSLTNKENGSTFLQDRAQTILTGGQSIPPESGKLLEDLARYGDKLINELQKERADLQQQIDAADKQLKSTRQFLEEQAVERESERDEFAKEVTSLQNQLKERGKNWASHEIITSQVSESVQPKSGKISLTVEELEVQLRETSALLKETENKKEMVEAELKDAIDKVWVLRDIISELEVQLNSKSAKEALLEQKLDELEAELDQQNGTQFAMAQELESLRSQSLEDGYLEQIKQLQENIKIQFNSSVVRSIKSQIRDMEKVLEQRTKELETFYLTTSSNSLSSPSEEVSLREQLELSRSKTPEQCPSPVSLPVEEVSRLQDRLQRHGRAEEVLIKRLKDLQLTTGKLSAELEELHAERDVMQHQMKKQMVQLAEANNKIDDLRHKVETAQTAANKDLVLQVQELLEKCSSSEQALDSLQNQLAENRGQLAHAEEIINKQQTELRNLAHCDHEVVDSLRLQLAAVTAERNKLEELLDKHKREYSMDVVNALLADKNEDIDHLQQTVAMLQTQTDDDEKHGSYNSKGYRVSFATDIEESSRISEDMRLRDAPLEQSLDLRSENIRVFEGLSPISCEKYDEHIEHSLPGNLSLSVSVTSPSEPEDNVELEMNNLKLELTEKSDKIQSLEKEVEYLKTIKVDLQTTKSELESVVSSITEDKAYYENQLQSLNEQISNKDDEIKKLKKKLFHKDEEIIKTTADVQALREISLSLQEKLREATELAENENNSILKEELSRLNAEIKSKENEVSKLEQELVAYKNDLNDEKELCDTLKSSLNIITKEKLKLEDKINELRVENSNLLNALQSAEDNFDKYVTAVKHLKNDLFSKRFSESKRDSKLGKFPEESDVSKLRQEILNLVDANERLVSERTQLLEDIDNLKSTMNSANFAAKDEKINQLQDELRDLRKAVLSVKEEKLSVFSNFSSEINQLHKDMESLQESKQEAIEKWKNERSEKEALQEMYDSIKSELEFERQKYNDEQEERDLRRRQLTFCDIDILDIPPVNCVPGLDALAEKMRQEIKLSATLDNNLLETILPDNNEALATGETFQADTNFDKCSSEILKKLRSLEDALLAEVERCREAKSTLREKENKCRELETERSHLKLHIDHLTRHISFQNDKINNLLSQVNSHKEKIIALELTTLKEQTNLKQVNALLEEERNKAREVQRDDITLIETMRQRLQNLMENEIKLKEMVIQERQKNERLTAELNSVQALEKYRTESDDEQTKNVKKLILHERKKYKALHVEYEKEKRTCEDLREVLARERTALYLHRDNLAKSERARSEMEKEMSSLKQKLNKEVLRRQLAESKIAETEGSSDSRFQKQLQLLENKNKKSLDAAYAHIRELEHDYNEMKRYLQSQQVQDDNWKENVHAPLLQQLNEVNDNLDALVRERVDLKRTIERLNHENSRLHDLVEDLRKVSPLSEPAGVQLEDAGLELRGAGLQQQTQADTLEAIIPFMEREVDDLLIRALHAERHRKALIFQKRYLLASLRGCESDAHSVAVLRLSTNLRLRPVPRRSISFRSVALGVLAMFKIAKLPWKRLVRYNNKKEHLFRSLKTSLTRSTAEAERLALGPPVRQTAPHSPPSRERATLRFR